MIYLLFELNKLITYKTAVFHPAVSIAIRKEVYFFPPSGPSGYKSNVRTNTCSGGSKLIYSKSVK
jgi:hypothetical protein